MNSPPFSTSAPLADVGPYQLIPIPESDLARTLDILSTITETQSMAAPRSLFAIILLLATTSLAECYPFASAQEHLGEVKCIRGKVVKLVIGPTGLHFLNFCEDYKNCPFTVVVFPRDLRDVGDVRTLEGKEIQITGKIKAYKGQLEIILRDRSQLRGDTAGLPNLPKGYDAEKRGSFSAGTFSSPRSNNSQKTTKKGRRDPTFPEDE